jgi:hypothetical protein
VLNTTLSSLKKTVSPAGIVNLLIIRVASEAELEFGTKYKSKSLARTVSSVRSTVPVLHTIIVVIALLPLLV